MIKLIIPAVLCLFTLSLKAQNKAVAALTQPYGKIDTADLKLTPYDFEKGAGAIMLLARQK